MSRNYHASPLTARLADRQDWCCVYCEFAMARDLLEAQVMAYVEAPRSRGLIVPAVARAATCICVSFDHFQPRSEGGHTFPGNGLAACRWCNNRRGVIDALEFKAMAVALVIAGQHPRQIFRTTGHWPVTHIDRGHVAARRAFA